MSYKITAYSYGTNVSEIFQYRYFVLRAAKVALKKGFSVTITKATPTPRKEN